MSTKIMHACWDLQLPLAKKMLLISLADQANDDGICAPAPDSTAVRCCMHRATLFRSLDWLEERGYIKRQGAGNRRKTYLLTPHLGRCKPGDSDGLVVAESDHGSRTVRPPESQAATTVVAESDHGSRTVRPPAPSFSPLINPPLSLKEERGRARAREGGSASSEAVVGIPADFQPAPWVAERLAMASLPRVFEPAHVQHFIAHHQAKGTLRRPEAWSNEFVSWMIREHRQFSRAQIPPKSAPTPDQQRAQAFQAQLANRVSDLRGAHQFRRPPTWDDAAASAALCELGDLTQFFALARDEFEARVVKPFARLYRDRVMGPTQRGTG